MSKLFPSLKNTAELIDALPNFLVGLSVVIIPLIVLPFGENLFKNSKNLTLFIITLLIIALFALQIVRKQVFRLVLSPFFLPLSLMALVSLAASLLSGASYPVEALLGWGGVYFCVGLIGILGGSLLSEKSGKLFALSLSLIAVLTSVLTVLEYAGSGASRAFTQIFQIPLVNPATFNLTGSIFIAAQVIFLGLIVALVQVAKNKEFKLWYLFTLPISLVGLGLSIWLSLPGKPTSPAIAPFQISWAVAINTLNVPKTALFGYGAESYSDVYNLLKPAAINTQADWNLSYLQASNTPLTLLTTMGLLGLTFWLMLAFKAMQQFTQIRGSNPNSLPLISVILAIFVLQFIFPANTIILAILGLSIAVFTAQRQKEYASIELHPLQVKFATADKVTKKISQYSKGFSYFLAGILSLLLIISSYGLFRAYAAYTQMFIAEKAALNNDAIGVYDHQRQAIAYNPFLDSFRRNYAITNLQIAIALNSQAAGEQNQAAGEQITTLVQQAIREGRAATTINGQDSQNWQALAGVYRQLIGSAEGAESWSVSAYSRAIELSPSDPSLRVELGGIFYGQDEFQQAATLFEQATLLKPDYAPGHYNLAVALKALNNFQLATQAYQQTLALLDPTSSDYAQAQSELQEVQAKLQVQTKQNQPAPEPAVNLIEESLPSQQPGVETQSQTQLDLGVQEALNEQVVPESTTEN